MAASKEPLFRHRPGSSREPEERARLLEAVARAAEALVGPVVLDHADSPLHAAVRALREHDGRHVASWAWEQLKPAIDHDQGDA